MACVWIKVTDSGSELETAAGAGYCACDATQYRLVPISASRHSHRPFLGVNEIGNNKSWI
ncbi:hypothetical protein R50072_07240 [Simiduia litorea]